MTTKVLSVDLPRIDADTQSRVAIDDDVVSDYTDIIEESTAWPFPPIDVFHDGTDYLIADGFHRFLAAHRAKRGSIPCKVHKGTARDARIFGMTANDKHGLRMSRADKRACVEWLLDHGGKMAQKTVAEKAGVSIRTVQAVVADRKPTPPEAQAQVAAFVPTAGNASAQEERENPQVAAFVPPAGGAESESGSPAEGEKCPNCASTKWRTDDIGTFCVKCQQPWGEPSGGPDEERVNTQRQKTCKTAEALRRAFDDLNHLKPKKGHTDAVKQCKALLVTARQWK